MTQGPGAAAAAGLPSPSSAPAVWARHRHRREKGEENAIPIPYAGRDDDAVPGRVPGLPACLYVTTATLPSKDGEHRSRQRRSVPQGHRGHSRRVEVPRGFGNWELGITTRRHETHGIRHRYGGPVVMPGCPTARLQPACTVRVSDLLSPVADDRAASWGRVVQLGPRSWKNTGDRGRATALALVAGGPRPRACCRGRTRTASRILVPASGARAASFVRFLTERYWHKNEDSEF